MRVELVEGFFQKVSESHNHQDKSQGNERLTSPQAEYHQGPRKQLNERNNYANEPKRPKR